MTRGGRETRRDQPERRCMATGQSGPAARLVRFVLGPGGVVVPDVAGRLPGRGMWLSADPAAIELAVRKRLFARAAREPVQVPDGLAALVEAQLAARVVELVSLARKGGGAVAGYEKVRDWLIKDKAAVLVQAADGSPRGRARLRPPAGPGSHVQVLTARELGLAFGREHVIHAALVAGGLAQRVVEDAARLAGMRGQVGADGVGKDDLDA